jgi:alginate O-acetyltransferase complex protein AlgI
MLFNSFAFLVFFPVVTILFFILPHRFRWILLLAASCVFYMFFIPVYILILVFTILVDYFAGILIENSAQHKKLWLTASIIANIGTLAVFKYYNFFVHDINNAFNTHWVLLHVILPIGLSFHTFQALSYTIDVYKGNYKAEKHLGLYALYVMFYPQLVAGPIERPQHMFHQFKTERHFKWQNILDGLRLMLWGFFMKLVIADRLSAYVAAVFDHPNHFHPLNIWIGVFFFAIQIYCDFAGYSNIAIGSAKTMGYELMLNFNKPYFAINLREYWHRWHISLSTWFRDYVYKPLGGSLKSNGRTIINIMIVFTLSGLWHGAGWNFIVWGVINGIGLVAYTLINKKYSFKGSIASFIGWTTTMLFIGFGWIFFRASSFHRALLVIKDMFTGSRIKFTTDILYDHFAYGNINLLVVMLCIAGMFSIEKIYDPRLLAFNRSAIKDIIFCTAMIVLILFFGVFTKQSFIYFQF